METAAHTPASQVVPAQHSVSSTQLRPAAWHRHRPEAVSQSMYPQQSRELRHDCACRWQHRGLMGVGRQSKSPQHSEASSQVELGAPQAEHTPRSQESGDAQPVPEQQACPRAPQALVAAPQRPALHTSPALQTSPAQHACPLAPQVEGRSHVPPEQVRPVSQTSPAQQPCPSAPHSGGASQTPDAHARPVSQAPSQQGAPSPPQAAQRPITQEFPAEQTVPEQQRWPSPPQSSAR